MQSLGTLSTCSVREAPSSNTNTDSVIMMLQSNCTFIMFRIGSVLYACDGGIKEGFSEAMKWQSDIARGLCDQQQECHLQGCGHVWGKNISSCAGTFSILRITTESINQQYQHATFLFLGLDESTYSYHIIYSCHDGMIKTTIDDTTECGNVTV